MKTPTYLHLGYEKPALLQLIVVFGIVLIPFIGYSSKNNFHFYNDDSCEEMEDFFFTGERTFSSLRITPSICCDNANSPTDGQFSSVIEIYGRSGGVWYVDDAIGMYEGVVNCSVWQAPVALDYGQAGTNNIFSENPGGHPSPDSSLYTLPILTVHGEPNLIRLKSNMGDIISLIGESQKYKHPIINGALSVCTGMLSSYSVSSQFSDGTWTLLDGGGMIHSQTGNKFSIEWGGTPGIYQIMYEEGDVEDVCYAPKIISVAVGQLTGSSMNCKGPQNISLGSDCELQLTPGMILAGQIDGDIPYSVMILDKHNRTIPHATFNEEHIGGTFTIKVFDSCSGNSCWSELTIEDKLKPIINCATVPDTLYCYKKDQNTAPLAYDNCTEPVEVLLIDSTFIPLDCDPDFIGSLKKTFVAVDEAGNYSETCDQFIWLRRINLDDITPPENHLLVEMNGITCKDYKEQRLPNGDLDPEYFGVPSIDGVPLWPDNEVFCGVNAWYKDKDGGTVGGSGNVKKIIRTWTIFEWTCDGGNTRKFNQMIEVEDNEAPIINNAPDSLTFSANSGVCEAYGYFPPIDATEDDCFDSEVHVRIDGILNTNGGYAKLPEGIHYVDYIVSDNRGNADTVTVKVKVMDLSAPVAVCIQYMVIGLDEYGQAVLPAEAVNNGSHDACGIDYVEIRRMDDTVSCQNLVFSPYVEFCCEDSGFRRMVELRVWDNNGNSNICMAEIEVQDKYKPQIQRLPGFEIFCGDDLKLADLEVPEVLDACDVITSDTLIYDINDCGSGTITRVFTATDANGTAVMEQIITVSNDGVFEMNSEDWPADVDTIAICDVGELDPDDLPEYAQRPVVPYDMCSDVYVTHTDDIYRFSETTVNACYKIIRRWTVIDWCQKDDSGDPRRWEYEQVIKVNNEDVPEITSSLEDVEICSDECPSGFISLTAVGKDSCTADDELRWTYQLVLNSDGSVEDKKSGKGNTAKIEGDYPIGSYTLVWIFSDQCGNTATGSQEVVIKSCKPPVIKLVDGAAIGLTPMDLVGNDNVIDDEMACIHVDSLDVNSFHPCDIPFELSFSPDSIQKEMCFNCIDLGQNEVWVYGIDTFGNIDSITIIIDVQDNNNVDFCASLCDCVEFPADLEVEECSPDLSPMGLGSIPTVDPGCLCNDFTITSVSDTIESPGPDCIALVRTWTVTFNCGFRPLVCQDVQNIIVFNTSSPVITCPDTIRMAASPDSCEVYVDMEDAIASGDCNTGVIITNDYNGGGNNASDVYPVGETKVKFVAVDECGNADTCYVSVFVSDDIDPECDPMDSITVTITSGTSVTILDPSTIDVGSFDNCEIDRFELSDSTFTCDQIGMQNVTTTFIVYDNSGNSSECEVRVTVVDGGELTCAAIPNLTAYLDEFGQVSITPAEIDGGSGAGCAIIPELSIDRDMFTCVDVTVSPITVTLKVKVGSDSLTCVTMVTVKDTLLPMGRIIEDMKMINCDEFSGDIKAELGGVFGINDNCDSSTVMVDTVITNMTAICGEGSYFVKLILTDICGNIDSTGEVEIMIVNDNPFSIDSIIFPTPKEILLSSCGDISPSALGSDIVINDDDGICSNVESFYIDNPLSDNFFCNDTIMRVWTVVDSCQLDGMGGGIWLDTQLIIINDITPPVVVGPPDMTIANANSLEDCVVSVVLMGATATDNCTPSEDIELTNNSPFAFDTISGDISGDYDPGVYDIEIYGEDLCGNLDTFKVKLTIEEPTGQGIPCKKVFTNIKSDLTATVFVSEFIITNSNDACVNLDDLIFSFDRNDIGVIFLDFNCDNVGERSPGNPLGIDAPIYAFDSLGILVDSCLSTIGVSDNNDLCPDNAAQGVSGEVYTYSGDNVEGVNINLEGEINQVFKTGESGSYAFMNLENGSSFNVVPSKNDDVLNGVSTLDLIKIQRHILGLQEFTNGYQYVAADINNNMNISVADILELRKVILGIYDEFKNNSSWRMVDGNYSFPENDDPLSIEWPETYTVSNLASFMKVDFVGVKIGDVDGDAKGNFRSGITTRSNDEITFGKEILGNSVALKSMDQHKIFGVQFRLNVYNKNIDIKSSLPGFNSSHYFLNNGILNISWNSEYPFSLNEGDELFTISGTNNAELLDARVAPSVYIQENGDILNYRLNLQEITGKDLMVLPNTPNPWADYTEINFSINYKDQVLINFFDSSGKLLTKKLVNAHQGLNKIRILKDDLPGSGLIIYEIISSKEKNQGKMILLK